MIGVYEVFITSSAKKAIKRLNKEVKEKIVEICENQISHSPFASAQLEKPLHECRSVHFSLRGVIYRIVYKIAVEQRIDIILIGTRENFYQKLRRALDL